MDADTIRQVRQRAVGRCEYCQLSSSVHPTPFQTDHIIAKQHGGTDELDNLAFACIHCNRYKGPNIAGIDPDTSSLAAEKNQAAAVPKAIKTARRMVRKKR